MINKKARKEFKLSGTVRIKPEDITVHSVGKSDWPDTEPIIEGESEITFLDTSIDKVVIAEPYADMSYTEHDLLTMESIEQSGESFIYTEPKLDWWAKIKLFIKRIITKMKNESNY